MKSLLPTMLRTSRKAPYVCFIFHCAGKPLNKAKTRRFRELAILWVFFPPFICHFHVELCYLAGTTRKKKVRKFSRPPRKKCPFAVLRFHARLELAFLFGVICITSGISWKEKKPTGPFKLPRCSFSEAAWVLSMVGVVEPSVSEGHGCLPCMFAGDVIDKT